MLEQFWFGANYFRRSLSESDLDGSWLVWDKRTPESDAGLGSGFELCWSKQKHKQCVLRHLWMGFTARERDESRVHPTQKPVSLVTEILDRWIPKSSVIVDPYAGSGTVLMACHRTGRVSLSIEIEPSYCDVICRRFQEHTGIIPTRDGVPHDFTA